MGKEDAKRPQGPHLALSPLPGEARLRPQRGELPGAGREVHSLRRNAVATI